MSRRRRVSQVGRAAARAAHAVERAASRRFPDAVADVVRFADGRQLRLDFEADDWRQREVDFIFGRAGE